ncbi:4'-phosphopantetheinyl transferase superfamily protein [Kitasatospora sp. MMS16-BH015]|uniref:4'-phosphopantetheinyl transferase family protein n=1 Tax=Kitasatospora sp. MMS16-BH015 TaxID=2018025 RepID=UPI0020C2AE5A|nr:4'-phosphopantetheinyl transferase superfamily protein [Kitasatospora sp. MMS16-BH015]
MTGVEAAAAKPFGPPIRITGRDGPWAPVTRSVQEYGTALVYAHLDDWRPDRAAGPRLQRLLGRDWAKYLELTHLDVRIRFAASRILLKTAVGRLFGVGPEEVELGYRDKGRPFIRGNDSVDVSISHTDGLLLVGLSTQGQIGVDVEPADRELYDQGLARHLCTETELKRVEALPYELRNAELLRIWTLKEAYTKAIGTGLMSSFGSFSVDGSGSCHGLRGPDGEPADTGTWYSATFTDEPEYVLSVAVVDDGFGSDTQAATGARLNDGLVSALIDALGEEEPDQGADSDW